MEGMQEQPGGATTTTMNVKNYAAKFSDKGSIYRFLTVECKFYLPDYKTVNIWHLKDLQSGEKTVSSNFSSLSFVANLLRGRQVHLRAPV